MIIITTKLWLTGGTSETWFDGNINMEMGDDYLYIIADKSQNDFRTRPNWYIPRRDIVSIRGEW